MATLRAVITASGALQAKVGIGNVYPKGEDGKGVPPGGRAGQLLYKVSDADFDTAWMDLVIPPEYGRISYSGFELTVS